MSNGIDCTSNDFIDKYRYKPVIWINIYTYFVFYFMIKMTINLKIKEYILIRFDVNTLIIKE